MNLKIISVVIGMTAPGVAGAATFINSTNWYPRTIAAIAKAKAHLKLAQLAFEGGDIETLIDKLRAEGKAVARANTYLFYAKDDNVETVDDFDVLKDKARAKCYSAVTPASKIISYEQGFGKAVDVLALIDQSRKILNQCRRTVDRILSISNGN